MIATTTTFPWGADPFAGVPALRSPTYGLDDPSVSPSTTEAFPASTVQSLLAQHRHATETVARRANLVLATVAKTLGYPLSSVGIVGHGPVAARLTCMVEATTATNLCIATRLPTTTTLPSNEKSPHITTTCDLTRAISSSQPTGSPGIAVVICVPPTALAAVAQLYAGAMTNSNAIVVVIAAGAVTTVVRRMFLAAGMATAHRNVLVIARDPTVVEVDREADRALVRDAVATAAENLLQELLRRDRRHDPRPR
ncbi:hypothetical protein BC828DRAFT_405242 [Blastocladiella britannica]|nr:hypothetical protein BC828DRAFT_405242 [Blastocladiella britannica]